MTDLTIEGNYMKITQNHETPDGTISPVVGYYPITLTFISYNFEVSTDSKTGKQAWLPFSVTIHNTALNKSCTITNAEILAGNVMRDSKLPFISITDLTQYLSQRTGAPIEDTESELVAPIATPIKTIG